MINVEITIFIIYCVGVLFNIFTNKYIISTSDELDSFVDIVTLRESFRLFFIIFSWLSWIAYGIVIITEKYDTRR